MFQKMEQATPRLLAMNLEITARCNNNCRHCYINLPANSRRAKAEEISFDTLKSVADQAHELGVLWCLLTGGEPLLREDFEEIYIYLKKKGFLVSVFTNACLIKQSHIELFKKWPPRDLEVTVYGTTQKTYERVTRKKGSFEAFDRGLNLLLEAGIPVSIKAMAMRSNRDEFDEIARFCRKHSSSAFRFDPMLHLRLDRDPHRNREIQAERLTPEEIYVLEQHDEMRSAAIKKACDSTRGKTATQKEGAYLFACGTGLNECTIGYDGMFRMCTSLMHPDCVVDLKTESLADAMTKRVPEIRQWRSDHKDFLENCGTCSLFDLCLWCPAHAYLETGKLDQPVPYFCEVTKGRVAGIGRDWRSVIRGKNEGRQKSRR